MRILLLVLTLFSLNSFAELTPKAYFACTVKEGRTNVQVKFLIKDFDPNNQKGELALYPGADEEEGLILVTPKEVRGKYTRMTNLNGQGGDLRILNSGDIFLFGDGDGYQYTDLVIWGDLTTDVNFIEGFVRDYGPAYGDRPSFKAFITCKMSKRQL